jgi:hypothetical protein
VRQVTAHTSFKRVLLNTHLADSFARLRSASPSVVAGCFTGLKRRSFVAGLVLCVILRASAFAQTFGGGGGNLGITGVVTSVGVSAPPDIGVANSPITSSGTIALTHTGQTCTAASCTVTAGEVSANATSNNVAADLPVTAGTYNPIEICKTDSSANTVTLTPNGTDTINGASSLVLSKQHQCAQIVDVSAGLWSVRNVAYPVAQTLTTHNFATALSANAVLSGARPASTDLSDLPIPVSSGGTQCGAPVAYASLPGSPTNGEICTVTDSSVGCIAGTAVTAGGGSTNCQVTYNGTSWMPGGGLAAGGSNYATAVNSSGTSVTATCSATTGTHPSSDLVWQVLTANTTYTTPASTSNCLEGDTIVGHFIQADNQAYQVTPAAGAGTTLAQPTIPATPTSTGTGQGYFLDVAYRYHASLAKWELVYVSTNPLSPIPSQQLGGSLDIYGSASTVTTLTDNSPEYIICNKNSTSGDPDLIKLPIATGSNTIFIVYGYYANQLLTNAYRSCDVAAGEAGDTASGINANFNFAVDQYNAVVLVDHAAGDWEEFWVPCTWTGSGITCGGNDSLFTIQGALTVGNTTRFVGNINGPAGHLLTSATAPTISSGFGTSPSIPASNSTAAFDVNVGTGGTASSGVIGLPAAVTGWSCGCADVTTAAGDYILQTASTTSSCTVTNYSAAATTAAWTASDILSCRALAY